MKKHGKLKALTEKILEGILVLDFKGTVLYCNAGHPPALLVQRDGTIDRLQTGGLLIGPTPTARYQIGIAQMDPGDLLILFTDGITEAASADSGEEYGDSRLVHLAHAIRHLDPVAVVDRVFADVAEYSDGAPAADDQTVVAVKRHPAQPEETPA